MSTIQELTTAYQWRHFPSSNNPADIISIKIDPIKLLLGNLWDRSRSFLVSDEYPTKPTSTDA